MATQALYARNPWGDVYIQADGGDPGVVMADESDFTYADFPADPGNPPTYEYNFGLGDAVMEFDLDVFTGVGTVVGASWYFRTDNDRGYMPMELRLDGELVASATAEFSEGSAITVSGTWTPWADWATFGAALASGVRGRFTSDGPLNGGTFYQFYVVVTYDDGTGLGPFVAPPLRQFPRSDGLASSARRTHPSAPSIQRSNRRGPGSYL